MLVAMAVAAGLASAAQAEPFPPLKIDVEAMKSGQLPPAGTPEEADACAVHAQLVAMIVINSPKFDTAPKDRVNEIVHLSIAWLDRAAGYRKTTWRSLQTDKASTEVVMAWGKAASPNLIVPLEDGCTRRINALDNKS